MEFKNIESNPILDRLPKHLRQFIKPQNYEDYSAIDQAVWRYAMRKNVDYLSQVAHNTYLEGLQQTGISVDAIPNMYGMNRILKAIGWAAVMESRCASVHDVLHFCGTFTGVFGDCAKSLAFL